MSNLAYLLIAFGSSVILSLLVWAARYRKPKTLMSSIDEFRREMDALGRDANEPEPRRRPRGNGRAGNRPDPIMPAPEQGDLARGLNEARRSSEDERYLDGER